MVYPPPPGLIFLAYSCGKISKEDVIKLWWEKNKPPEEDNNNEDAQS